MFMHQKMHFEGKINEIFYFKNPHTTFLVLGPFVMVLKIGLPTQKIEQSPYIALQQKVLVFTKSFSRENKILVKALKQSSIKNRIRIV